MAVLCLARVPQIGPAPGGGVMSKSVLACCLVVGAALVQAGCETTKSSNPLSPTIAGPIPGVVITAPKLLLPTAGQRIAVTEQPVTLTIENPTTTGVGP